MTVSLCEPCYNEFAVEFNDVKKHILKTEILESWHLMKEVQPNNNPRPRSFGVARLTTLHRLLANHNLTQRLDSNPVVQLLRATMSRYEHLRNNSKKMYRDDWKCFECGTLDKHVSGIVDWNFHNTILDGSITVPYFFTKDNYIAKSFGCPCCRQFLHSICGLLVHLVRWHGQTKREIAERFGTLAEKFVLEHFSAVV